MGDDSHEPEVKPTFLIIGSEKAGTTWLYDRLRRHPDVFMPLVKELHYFNRRNSNIEPTDVTFGPENWAWYLSHFSEPGSASAMGEATPMYLCDPSAPERIHSVLPDVKLIACLRHPTERAYSHYWMAKGKNHTSMSFEEVVQQREERFIERGRYGRQLDRYLDRFDREQLLILIHEEVFESPSESLNRVCSFLGVDNTFYQNQAWITEKVHPSSTERSILLHRAIGAVAKWMRQHQGTRQVLDWLKSIGLAGRLKKANKKTRQYPEMPSGLRRELDQYYSDTLVSVEELLGRKIAVWRDRSMIASISEE